MNDLRLPRIIILVLFVNIKSVSSVDSGSSTPAEQLATQINDYREENNLDRVPFSITLMTVGQLHSENTEWSINNTPSMWDDSNCNLHSWDEIPNETRYTFCCYTSDHAQSECMWSKPTEISESSSSLITFSGNGFENSAWGFTSTSDALTGWKGSPGHNSVILNLGIWENVSWQSLGCGVDLNQRIYHCWFSDSSDPNDYPTTPITSTSLPTINPSQRPSDSPSSSTTTTHPSELPSKSPTTNSPSMNPTHRPSLSATTSPSNSPSQRPSESPTISPSSSPTKRPSASPSEHPTISPSMRSSSGFPTQHPSSDPSKPPTKSPTDSPTLRPFSLNPSNSPSNRPSDHPSLRPTLSPSMNPSTTPVRNPTVSPSTNQLTIIPTDSPSNRPSESPSQRPSNSPSLSPSIRPSISPSIRPSVSPTPNPSNAPSNRPSVSPSQKPSESPSNVPTSNPTISTSPVLSTDIPTHSPSAAQAIRPTVQPSTEVGSTTSVSPSLIPTQEEEMIQECGNGVCESGEDCVNCPRDCSGNNRGRQSRRFCCIGGDSADQVKCRGWGCPRRLSKCHIGDIMTCLPRGSRCWWDGQCCDRRCRNRWCR